MQTLKELRLKNYRNLRIPDGISFDPLTIFVGPNGYGKTNVIKVLRFLQDAAIGTVDERRGTTQFEVAVAGWGGNGILDATIEMPSVIEVEIGLQPNDKLSQSFNLRLVVNGNGIGVFVHRESFSYRHPDTDALDADYYYEANVASGRSTVFLDHNDGKLSTVGNEIFLPFNDLVIHSVQNWLEQYGDIPSKNLPFYEGKRVFINCVRTWAFYDASQMSLDSIRQAPQETGQGDTILTPTGENLPLVMFNLCSKDIDFQERILRAMQELFPDTRAFRPNVVGRVSLTIEWYRKEIKRPFYLDEMSDGTIRMLCWATVLLSPELPSLIVLDEPEASIHPAWLRILAGWIREAARKTQVIVSTHSSDLLDYFTEDAASVRVFERDAENPTYATVRALDPAMVADKFAEGWKLGDLYRVGDPELGGWPW